MILAAIIAFCVGYVARGYIFVAWLHKEVDKIKDEAEL